MQRIDAGCQLHYRSIERLLCYFFSIVMILNGFAAKHIVFIKFLTNLTRCFYS